jgi:pimeloyl-ACP methyl ester carboxylesterase
VLVTDLEAIVDAAKLDRFALVGTSQGGALSIAYAARHPERVSHIVLLGAFARGPLRRDPTETQLASLELIESRNRANDRALVLPSEYLEAVIDRR